MGQPRPKSEPQRLKPDGLACLNRPDWKSCPSLPDGSRDVAQGLKPAFITDLYAALKRRSSTVQLAVAAREVVPFPYGACGIAKAMP